MAVVCDAVPHGNVVAKRLRVWRRVGQKKLLGALKSAFGFVYFLFVSFWLFGCYFFLFLCSFARENDEGK